MLQSEQDDASSPPDRSNRGGRGVRGAGRLDDDVRTRAVCCRADGSCRRLRPRVDDLIGTELAGRLEPPFVHVHRDHRRHPSLDTARENEAPDAAHPDHGERLARTGASTRQGVACDGKRLCDGGRDVVACVRDGHTDAGRRRDELCQAAVRVEAERVVALAQIRPAEAAPAACPARHSGSGNDAVPDTEARDPCSD